MSDSNPPAPWSAAEAATAAPRCPTCDTHDYVELVTVGTDKNRMRRWYCAAPFCHSVFQVADVASDQARRMHRRYFVMLRNYLAEHPERMQPHTDAVLDREPVDQAALV